MSNVANELWPTAAALTTTDWLGKLLSPLYGSLESVGTYRAHKLKLPVVVGVQFRVAPPPATNPITFASLVSVQAVLLEEK
jgi:hypothetical protein